MTVLDLAKLIKHHWKIAVIVPAACVTLSKAIEAEGGTSKVVDIAHGGAVAGGTSGAGGIEIQSCQSLASGMSGMYTAKAADAVVVSARQWTDSLRDLEDTLQELSLAQANVAGLVLVQ